jgi:predicted transcriptional regulator
MSVSALFSLRVRLDRCEVEISGNRDEVLKTVSDLPNLVATISEAFAQAGVEVSKEPVFDQTSSLPSSAPVSVVYPSIQSSGNCSEAVLKLLSSDWGRATPRTLPELIEAMKANAVHFPATTLSGVLNWLVRKGRVKRWKTAKGYVYVLSGPNVGRDQLQAKAQTEMNVGVASSSGG